MRPNVCIGLDVDKFDRFLAQHVLVTMAAEFTELEQVRNMYTAKDPKTLTRPQAGLTLFKHVTCGHFTGCLSIPDEISCAHCNRSRAHLECTRLRTIKSVVLYLNLVRLWELTRQDQEDDARNVLHRYAT